MPRKRFSLFALLILLTGPAGIETAWGAVYMVDRTDDSIDAAAQVCSAAPNDCSLRGAVVKANADAVEDWVILPASKDPYTLAIPTGNDEGGENDLDATEGDIDITQPLAVSGDGADVTTVQAGQGFDDRIFHVKPSVDGTVTLSGLTIDAGHVPTGRGGAVFLKSGGTNTIVIDGCHIKNGNGSDGGGVGMNDSLSLVIRNSTLSDNASTSRGGGLFCETGDCLIVNSTFSNNTVNGVGGGAVDNSTGGLTIIHSTFVKNSAAAGNVGGGIRLGFKGMTVKNSVFAGNTVDGAAANCATEGSTITSNGYNLSDDASCGFSGTGDQNSVTATLVNATLAGGPTPIHFLPKDSPAVGLVPASSCTDKDGNPLATDQRGLIRPIDGNCEAGAGETGCGNGVKDWNETCDDGNLVNGDGCDVTCKPTGCGNGVATAGEECDDGNQKDDDACRNDCKRNVCGDGVTGPGQACDDGNQNDLDGCRNSCNLPACGDGTVDAGEACDDGNASNEDACLATCVAAGCGDGFVQTGVEGCDDQNSVNTDACLNTCKAATCGDGFLKASGFEKCDDGNTVGGDGCSASCQIEVPPAPPAAVCGNGIVEAGEQCEPSTFKKTLFQFCSSQCKKVWIFKKLLFKFF